MTEAGPAPDDWIRLSDACQHLRAEGVGEADLLLTIAHAGRCGRIIANGFCSIQANGNCASALTRSDVRAMMWRVLSSPKAGDKGYHCGILGEDLFWSRGNRIDEVQQEQWRSVLVDRPGFEALLRELAVLSPVQKVTAGETAEWIAAYPGSNSKEGWAAYKRHYGARAAKRDEVFQPMWREIHGEPSRGRPRKSPNDQ